MPLINLTKDKIPFWQDGNGTLNVDAGNVSLNQPLPFSNNDLATVNFGVAGDSNFTFGALNDFKLSVQAGFRAALSPLWPSSTQARRAILEQYGLEKYFDLHPDMLILGLALNANANASAAGGFKYSVLSANLKLDVGGQAGYTYLRPFRADQKAEGIIAEFFRNISLPAGVTEPLEPGEVKAFEFGGYLKLGASLSVGYELTGAPSFDIGQLQMSEKYSLSVIGSLGLNAGIAGYYSVAAIGVEPTPGDPSRWVRFKVHRKRHSELSMAADVNVSFASSPQKLPGSGKEFIGAALGLNAKNWLNLLDRVRQLSDFDQIKNELDGLSKRFISEWIGKGFEELNATDFPAFLARVQKVVNSYQQLDDSAITLFDRYFQKLDFLSARLDELTALTSWDQLSGEINSGLWEILQQLTDGDPLSWILGQIQNKDSNGLPVDVPSLTELKRRVQHVKQLIETEAHAEIREVIKLAKEKFPLDSFINQLAQVDTIPELKALANTKAGDFVTRLIGRSIDQISANQALNDAVKRLRKSLDAINNFEDKLFEKFKESLTQSFKFNAHAQYSRTDDREALIDVKIKVRDESGNPSPKGLALMRAAGSGDFVQVLAQYQPGVVQIVGGTLSHVVRKESSFSVNIEGWHSRWHYQGFDRVIIDAEQQIMSQPGGGIIINTTIDLTKDKERIRNGERVFTNFLLRFMGESSGLLQFDRKNQQYLIDSITGMSASYRLSFDDPKTSAKELQHYLSFAEVFKLDTLGANFQQLQLVLPTLPNQPNNFGRVTVDYEVRFTETALKKLFLSPFNEHDARMVMRQVLLANYVRQPNKAKMGWGYWTQGIYDLWKQQGPNFTNHLDAVDFPVIQPSPFPATPAPPPPLKLSPMELGVLNTLFQIEDSFIDSLKKLFSLVQSGGQMKPAAFENALDKFGKALKEFDDLDEGVNTVFAVLDRLVQLQTPEGKAHTSSMKLVSTVNIDGQPRQTEKQIIAQPET